MNKSGRINGRVKPDFCKHCNQMCTSEGHDACIGTLSGSSSRPVMNACCGHGDAKWAYVQFGHKDYAEDPNRDRVTGQEAMDYINEHKQVKK